MKIAFPTQEDIGLKSTVYSHFGSADLFIIVDSKTDEIETTGNKDLDHVHGKCQPLIALGGKKIDAVVVGGIGKGALQKLVEAGITIYRAVEGSVAENLSLFKSGRLPVFSMDQTCSGHSGIGECAH